MPNAKSKEGKARIPPPSTQALGIGLSKYALKPLERLLGSLTDLPECTVFIRRQASAQELELTPETVGGWTSRDVEFASDGRPVEAGKVYLIPPDTVFGMDEGIFKLSGHQRNQITRAPVDQLFGVLSRAFRDRCIAVLLTEEDPDGLNGARVVRSRNGFVLMQNAAENAFTASIASPHQLGFFDHVLPPDEIAAYANRLLQAGPSRPRTSHGESVDLSEHDRHAIGQILTFIRQECDHDFSPYRPTTLWRRIRRRIPLCDLRTLDEYLAFVREDPMEKRKLFDDLLITVTEFFRDKEVYALLASSVMPALFKGKTSAHEVRIWSVGCATGEEAYSLAILAMEQLSEMGDPPKFTIFATDLHAQALHAAREGYFPETIAEHISDERLQRFFTRVDDRYRVNKTIRNSIVFASHSILRDPPFSRQDMVFCRNVLIYFKRDAQRRILELLHYALQPGGILVLGSAETVEDAELFRTYDKKHNIFQRHKIEKSRPRLPLDFGSSDQLDFHAAPVSARQSPQERSYGELHKTVLERCAPPSLLLNANDDIVHFSEQANRFLFQPSGEPTNNIFKRIREELRIEMRAVLFAVREQKSNVRSKPVGLKIDGDDRVVILRVEAPGSRIDDDYLLVWFDEDSPSKADEKGKHKDIENGQLKEMAKELEEAKERLHATIEEYETQREELRSSNEELQSANEELRSTTEELETGKEELQSVNEELVTVNLENERKVEELSSMTSDLYNFLAATRIATVFLDLDQHIVRFTEEATRIFSIRRNDVGRSITDFNTNLKHEGLMGEIRSVLEGGKSIEREVGASDGAWYHLRILPYHTLEGEVEGVVITLHDVTDLKRAEESARQHGEELERLTANLETRIEERTDQLRELAGRITLAEQSERNRIAQILHEDLQQQLCSLRMKIDSGPSGDKAQEKLTANLSDSLGKLIHLTRTLSLDLSPPVLESEGFAGNLCYLRRMMAEEHHFKVGLSQEEGFPIARRDMRILLFSVVREVLFNAVKHSQVTEAQVHLEQKDQTLRILVEDGGVGFDVSILQQHEAENSSQGLRNLTNRLRFVGGSANIESSPDKGCRVFIEVPNEVGEAREGS